MKMPMSNVLSLMLVVGVLLFMQGWGVAQVVHAAQLSTLKDTMSSSVPSQTSNHVFEFSATSSLTSPDTIKIQFDPDNSLFSLINLNNADISATGFTPVTFCGAGSDEMQTVVSNTIGDRNVTFTVCPGDTVPAGAKTITLGGNKITNPATPGSYKINVITSDESGSTLVAIINQAVLTAAVDTSLTFSISGVAIGSTVNGDATTTATTTTATSIPFGTLASGTPKLVAQDLAVSTNAKNGFIVTVKQNQNLLSNSGADIDLFKDGAANVTPTAWTSPSAVFGNENTYGHYGLTSEDADLNSDEFGTALYAGNYGTTSRTVFSNSGPADGSTANIGRTRVGYKIQISALQEAANDYTNQLVYVCTPTF